MANTILTSAS